MPSAVPPNARAGSPGMDDLDQLLDFDNAVDDFMNDIPARNSNNSGNQDNETPEQPRDEDQEVQVKKKRAPVPKLDENRLLSDAGIPRLRKITKSRLKFRGKGHEFADISRLLNTYQLWLDDLYPRAKFRDALAMVEKVGHSKRMQVTRKAWLDDTKANRRALSPDRHVPSANDVRKTAAERESSIFGDLDRETAPTSRDAPNDDELDALMAEAGAGTTALKHQSGTFGEDGPDDDELDALLAENAPARPSAPVPAQSTTRRGPFEQDSDDEDEDELEALMAEQAASTTHGTKNAQGSPNADATAKHSNDDFADDEEAMASMGW